MRGLPSLLFPLLLFCAAAGCVERRLHIRTQPEGASVRVNGVRIGRSPVTWRFEHYGLVEVEVEKRGYEPAWRRFRLEAPWYQTPGIDFFADVVIPGSIRDEHVLDVKLDPLPARIPEEEVDRRVAALAGRARALRERTLAPPAETATRKKPGSGPEPEKAQ